MRKTLFFATKFALVAYVGAATVLPARAAVYSETARTKVITALSNTAAILKPFYRKNDGGDDDRLYRKRDVVLALAQMGDREGAWIAARHLKMDKLIFNHYSYWNLRTSIDHQAALHWVAAGQITRALKIAEDFSAPEMVKHDDDIEIGLDKCKADIWMAAASRLLKRGDRDGAIKLLAKATPIVSSSESLGARGFLAYLLGQAGYAKGSESEFSKARRDLRAYLKKDAIDRSMIDGLDQDAVSWLAVWHIRAGRFVEAGEVAEMEEGQMRAVTALLDGKVQRIWAGNDPQPEPTTVLAPVIEKLLTAARQSIHTGDRVAARHRLTAAGVFLRYLPRGFVDKSGKEIAAGLALKMAGLYEAIGDRKAAVKVRQSAMLFGDYVMNLPPAKRQDAWWQLVTNERYWNILTPAQKKTAIKALLQLPSTMMNDRQKFLQASGIVKFLFAHGREAEARMLARVALKRTLKGEVFYLEIADSMYTARTLHDRSAPKSADRALVERFLAWIHKYSTQPGNDFADAMMLAASGWPGEAVSILKIRPGDEQRVASLYAQHQGALETLGWISKVKNPDLRSGALAAVAAVLAEQRDKALPEPLYRWADDRLTDITRFPQR